MLLVEFNCEHCYRAALDRSRDLPTPEQAGTVFVVPFEDEIKGDVVCPRGHLVDIDEMRGTRTATDENSIPRGRRAGKRKQGDF